MPTRKTFFWLAAAGALYIIALNVGSGWLYVVTATLLAMPLMALLLSRLNCRRLQLAQSCAGHALREDALASRIVITNPHRLPRFFLRLDLFLGGSAASALIPFLGPRQSCRLELEFTGLRRGVYPGGSVIVSSSAPAGLARGRHSYDTDCPLVVYPRWHRLAGDWTAGQRNSGSTAASTTPSRSAASDYLGVRDYRPEDSPRSIHWPTSARIGKLAVIEFARQTATSPVFILDRFGGPSGFDTTSFETAVSLAASLVQREAAGSRRFAIGASPRGAAEAGLGHEPGPAMLWLAGVRPDAEVSLDLSGEGLPWPETTPVLILPSSRAYARLHESEFLAANPQAIVIMLDGRRFTHDPLAHTHFLDSRELDRLALAIGAGGGDMLLAGSEEEALACLADF
ncbi:MAG: DUF58 domain-containing protein [Thermoleophilia bacterium]